MGWLLLVAVSLALLPVVIAIATRQRIVYMRWVASWVGRDAKSERDRDSSVDRLLADPVPGSVVSVLADGYSGQGAVSLLDSGLRLTEPHGDRAATWGAFWPELAGYIVVGANGDLRIEVLDHGFVYVETRGRAVRDTWEAVLETKGVPLSGS